MKEMFIKLLFCITVSVTLNLSGIASDDRATVVPAKRYLFPQMEFATGYSLSNSRWNYEISAQSTKNTGNTAPAVQFQSGALSIPTLFSLTVNGIRSRNIQFGREDLKKWEDPKTGSAGCETVLNFDGAKIAVRIFMKKDSQLLFIRFAPALGSVESIQKIVFTNYACIHLDRDPKKRWTDEPYAREFSTPKRTVKEPPVQNRAVVLEPDENVLVFRDAKFGKNPGFMTFQTTPVVKATLLNGVYQTLTLELRPDFKEFTFAFWSSNRKQFTNAEFDTLLKQLPVQFKLEDTGKESIGK